MTDLPSPPAPLVPADQRDLLVAELVAALTATVGADPARDADALETSVRAAIGEVEVHLDYPLEDTAVWPDPASVDPRARRAILDLAAGELRRPGFAYGLAGYDDVDPMATRARAAILAAVGVGLKARWGVA